MLGRDINAILSQGTEGVTQILINLCKHTSLYTQKAESKVTDSIKGADSRKMERHFTGAQSDRQGGVDSN